MTWLGGRLMNVKPEGQGFLAVDRAPGENYSEERVFDEPVILGGAALGSPPGSGSGFLVA